MKILVTYFTETGNTGKIAQAIFDEVSKVHKAELKKIEEVSADSFSQYNLIFIGTPCQMGDLAAPVKKLLDALPRSPKYKIAGFFTHGAPPEEKEDYEKCFTTFNKVCQEKQIGYLGCFECQGFPTPKIHQIVTDYLIKRKGYTEERVKQRFERSKEHPNREDEKNARKFTQKVLSQI
ncbi:MAG: flavodoxin family protein [Candidatus Jordarchaeaceae archaeon]